MTELSNTNRLFENIRDLIKSARQQTVNYVNHTMVRTYYEVGKMIVEDEQEGEVQAVYGKNVLNNLSKQLTQEFGRGFSVRNLEQMRKFYLTYGFQKTQNVSAKFTLGFSHYVFLSRIADDKERSFYEIEATANQWTLEELKRQFNSALYLRLALSRNKDSIKELSEKGQIIKNPVDAIKDPYILEFLALREENSYSEAELEAALIDKLQDFLLELGKGFAFIARQKRITFAEKHFRIDLVFYNRLLNCFVLIDLKIGELDHGDLGQMQMYVNYYDREMKLPTEQPTIGLIICRTKDAAVVEYTLPEDNKHIFASEYQTVLPDEEVLRQLVKER